MSKLRGDRWKGNVMQVNILINLANRQEGEWYTWANPESILTQTFENQTRLFQSVHFNSVIVP